VIDSALDVWLAVAMSLAAFYIVWIFLDPDSYADIPSQPRWPSSEDGETDE
jgi:hypothetical protein